MFSKVYYKIILFLLFSTLVLSMFNIPPTCETFEKDYYNELIKCSNNKKCLEELNNKEVSKQIEECNNDQKIIDCNENNLLKVCSDQGVGGNLGVACTINDCNELIKTIEKCKYSTCSCSKWTNDPYCKL